MLKKLLFALAVLSSMFACRERAVEETTLSAETLDEKSDLVYGCVFYNRKIQGTLYDNWETTPSMQCQFDKGLVIRVGDQAPSHETPAGACQVLSTKIRKGFFNRRDDLVVNVLDFRLAKAPDKLNRSAAPNFSELGPEFQRDNRYYHEPVRSGSCTFFKGWIDEQPSDEIVINKNQVRIANMKAQNQYLGEWKSEVKKHLEESSK